jgi:hypothetical protein
MEYFCHMDKYVNKWQEGFAMWTNISHQHVVVDLCWIQAIRYANTKYKTLIAMIG